MRLIFTILLILAVMAVHTSEAEAQVARQELHHVDR